MPSMIVLASIVLAAVVIEANSSVGNRWLAPWPGLFGAGAVAVCARNARCRAGLRHI